LSRGGVGEGGAAVAATAMWLSVSCVVASFDADDGFRPSIAVQCRTQCGGRLRFSVFLFRSVRMLVDVRLGYRARVTGSCSRCFLLIYVTLLGIDSVPRLVAMCGWFLSCCFSSLAGWILPRKSCPPCPFFLPLVIFIRRVHDSSCVLGYPYVVRRPISCSVLVLGAHFLWEGNRGTLHILWYLRANFPSFFV